MYVFAVHTTEQADAYDGLDVGAWQFYVVPGATVVATGQGSMRFSTVTRLGAFPVPWNELGAAIASAVGPQRSAAQNA